MTRHRLTGAAIIAVAALTTACENAPPPQPPQLAQESSVIVLTEADNRTNLVLGVGDRFQTKLESIPTAGYTWHVTHLPDGLVETAEEDWEPTDPVNQSQPGFTGGSHYIIKSFKAVSTGDFDLVLIEGRPWELFEENGDLKQDWKSYAENRYQVSLRIRD